MAQHRDHVNSSCTHPPTNRCCCGAGAYWLKPNRGFASCSSCILQQCAISASSCIVTELMLPFLVAAACPRWAFGAGCSEECQCVKEHTLECSPRNGSCTCQPGYHGKKCHKGTTHSWLPHICFFLCPTNFSFFYPSAFFGCCYSCICILVMILWGFNPATVAGTLKVSLRIGGVLAWSNDNKNPEPKS